MAGEDNQIIFDKITKIKGGAYNEKLRFFTRSKGNEIDEKYLNKYTYYHWFIPSGGFVCDQDLYKNMKHKEHKYVHKCTYSTLHQYVIEFKQHDGNVIEISFYPRALMRDKKKYNKRTCLNPTHFFRLMTACYFAMVDIEKRFNITNAVFVFQGANDLDITKKKEILQIENPRSQTYGIVASRLNSQYGETFFVDESGYLPGYPKLNLYILYRTTDNIDMHGLNNFIDALKQEISEYNSKLESDNKCINLNKISD